MEGDDEAQHQGRDQQDGAPPLPDHPREEAVDGGARRPAGAVEGEQPEQGQSRRQHRQHIGLAQARSVRVDPETAQHQRRRHRQRPAVAESVAQGGGQAVQEGAAADQLGHQRQQGGPDQDHAGGLPGLAGGQDGTAGTGALRGPRAAGGGPTRRGT